MKMKRNNIKLVLNKKEEKLVSENVVYVGINKRNQDSKLFDLIKASQEFSIDPDINSSIIHPLVISNKDGVTKFGTGYEEGVEPANLGLSSNSYRFFNDEHIINNISMLFNVIRGLNSSFLLTSKPSCNSCNFDNSNRRYIHNVLLAFNLASYGFGNSMEPELFLVDRILLPSSGRNNSFSKNSSVKSNSAHESYSLLRISLINSVESLSDILSFSMSLLSSANDSFLCFLDLNSSIKKCSSWSTFINLFTISDSSINSSQEWDIYKAFYDLKNLGLIQKTNVCRDVNNGKELYFLDLDEKEKSLK